ncbi:MAG: homoserine kinase [Acidobacteriaceae bacterium]|nr:homoserine kinase [Acidobacteriaceae bacterium]
MSESAGMDSGLIAGEIAGKPIAGVRLRLPATSANLGPGFDAVGLAMGLALTIDATVHTPGGQELTIVATGRDAGRCSRTKNNMIFETYRDLLQRAGRTVLPLGLRIHNEIPLGMGCGSSAAALLAGVLLANHFGELGWSLHTCMEEACRREGHPDNVAACALGFLTASAVSDGSVVAATCGEELKWKLLLALPSASLATEKARALLPVNYSRADAVANVQRTALLISAFALGRGDLLRVAMQDRLHQPYRMEVCPLLPLLLPMAGEPGVLGVALSGAGPGVLLVVEAKAAVDEIVMRIRSVAGDPALEIVETRIGSGALQSPLPLQVSRL